MNEAKTAPWPAWRHLDGALAFQRIAESGKEPGPQMEAWMQARSQSAVREAFNRGVSMASHQKVKAA